MRLMPVSAVLMIFALTMVAPAGAVTQPGAGDQPIHVVSDSLEVDNKTQVATFVGAVKATQGDVTITCDKLEVYYHREAPPGKKQKAASSPAKGGGLMDDGGQVRKVVALGHVKVTQKDRVAVGRKATYWAGGRKILLEGRATVWRGKNQVSGEKITLFLDQDRSVVHGRPGKRVTVTIQPQKAKE